MYQDNEIVGAIVAGDPAGLAEAYAKYAAQLHVYCRTLLRNPADAADVVQDTFVIAASRVGGLRDPGRLRAWLFAVARNECLRRLRAAPALSAFDAADVPDEAVDVAGDVERAEVRALVHAAVRGLSRADRDVTLLQLSQGLDAGEIGDILGVSRNHASALMSRARRQLLGCVAVLLVSRAGRRDCRDLAGILGEWDGHLTPLWRKRVLRHVERCRTCSERRSRELRPAMLLGLAGGAVLAGAASMEAAAGTGVHVKIAGAADRAAPWMRSGFPRPLQPPRGLLVHPHGAQAAAGAAVAVAVVAVGLVYPGGPVGVHPHGWHRPPGPVPSASASPSPGAVPSGPASPPSPARTGDRAAPAALAATRPAAVASSSVPGTSPAASQPPPVVPSVTVSAVVPTVTLPVAGTLTVSTHTLVLTPLGGSFTITAQGGPVSWSVSEPSSLLGAVSVSPASGTLQAGQSATVTISTTLASLDSALTVNPGGEQVTVILGL